MGARGRERKVFKEISRSWVQVFCSLLLFLDRLLPSLGTCLTLPHVRSLPYLFSASASQGAKQGRSPGCSWARLPLARERAVGSGVPRGSAVLAGEEQPVGRSLQTSSPSWGSGPCKQHSCRMYGSVCCSHQPCQPWCPPLGPPQCFPWSCPSAQQQLALGLLNFHFSFFFFF